MRCPSIVDSPAIMMPSEPKLAKRTPFDMISRERGSSASAGSATRLPWATSSLRMVLFPSARRPLPPATTECPSASTPAPQSKAERALQGERRAEQVRQQAEDGIGEINQSMNTIGMATMLARLKAGAGALDDGIHGARGRLLDIVERAAGVLLSGSGTVQRADKDHRRRAEHRERATMWPAASGIALARIVA